MASANHAASFATSRAARLGIGLGAALGRVWLQVTAWIERSRQRHSLADLDDHLLRDIGISRDTARREIDKVFWRP